MTEKKTRPSASKRPHGRPTVYTLEKADQICDWYSNGKTLTQCCRELGISRATLYNWMVAHDDFFGRLTRARELFADSMADEALSIADTIQTGTVVEEGYDAAGAFKKTKTEDAIQRSRLRVETRLKLLAKWSPEKYGDKKQVDVTTITPVQVVFKDDLED